MTHCIFFDDARGVLSPLNDFRAAFDVRTGALTMFDRFRKGLGLTVAALRVPPHLEALCRERHHLPTNEPVASFPETVLLINGRCVIATPDIESFVRAPRVGQGLVDAATGDLVVAALGRQAARDFLTGVWPRLTEAHPTATPLLTRPWSSAPPATRRSA